MQIFESSLAYETTDWNGLLMESFANGVAPGILGPYHRFNTYLALLFHT